MLKAFCWSAVFIMLLFPVWAATECPECHKPVEISAPYCPRCGASLSQKIACSKCAYENDSSDEYCLNCTAKLSKNQQAKVQEPLPVKKIMTQPLPKAKASLSLYQVGDVKNLPTTAYTAPPGTILLYAYQVIEGSAAKDGLWEEEKGLPISRAKPVVVPAQTSCELLEEHTVVYKDPGRQGSLDALKVSAHSEHFTERDGRAISFNTLEGWVLKKHASSLRMKK